jgi:concentrative nucleoside transporter, CNT family
MPIAPLSGSKQHWPVTNERSVLAVAKSLGSGASMSILFSSVHAQSLVGLLGIPFVCWAASEDRRRFPWKLAVGALAVQLVLVVMFFGVPAARAVLAGVGAAVQALSNSSQAGAQFLFGFLAGGSAPYAVIDPGPSYLFAFRVLPVILVVCALSALLWHWGVLRLLARGFGLVFEKALGLSGPTALATAATIFLGQVEGPILVRAYLARLSRAELFKLMTAGMSCVSGAAMVAYASILKDALPNAAAHVFTASIITAPAGILLAQILVPGALDGVADRDELTTTEQTYGSSIEAIMAGTQMGLQVVLSIAATLIVFIAFVTLANALLGLLPFEGQAPVSVQSLLAFLFRPLAWSIGVPWSETPTAAHLLAQKLVLTEFSAFLELAHLPKGLLSEHSRVIMTYALCGFANIGSVGITAAGLGVLTPERRGEILNMVWKALFAGFLATCMTAALVAALPWQIFN